MRPGCWEGCGREGSFLDLFRRMMAVNDKLLLMLWYWSWRYLISSGSVTLCGEIGESRKPPDAPRERPYLLLAYLGLSSTILRL
jgi:hypothetical protein